MVLQTSREVTTEIIMVLRQTPPRNQTVMVLPQEKFTNYSPNLNSYGIIGMGMEVRDTQIQKRNGNGSERYTNTKKEWVFQFLDWQKSA